MPTYQDAITRLNQKLRDTEAWPDDGSKLEEQLYLLYNAAIAVLKGVPLSRLPQSESGALVDEAIGEAVKEFALPDDIFFYRTDAGLSALFFDGKLYYPRQAIPKESVVALNDNFMHRGSVLFAVDVAGQKVTASNVASATIRYFPEPAIPANDTEQYPLPDGNDYELAMSVVSTHVSGETIRDSGQSTFQTFLTQLYGDDINEQNQ